MQKERITGRALMFLNTVMAIIKRIIIKFKKVAAVQILDLKLSSGMQQ